MTMLGTLALAEAIRLGAKERPQVRKMLFGYFGAYGQLLYIDDTRRGGCSCPECVEIERSIKGLGSCALGAAMEATGTKANVGEESTAPLAEKFPLLKQPAPSNFKWCNQLHQGMDMNNTIHAAIICLNDHQRWTRERIADWVASL